MKRLLLALLLAVPSLSYSQAIPFKQRGPLLSLTASAVNIDHYYANNHNRVLWGWSAIPELNLRPHLGLQIDILNSYMRSVYPGQSRFVVAGGPRYNIRPVSRLSPFVFAEAGGVKFKTLGKNYSHWDPLVTVGLGVEYRITPRFAFSVIPAEYVGQKAIEDENTWNAGFAARAGFTINFSPEATCRDRPRCWLFGDPRRTLY